MANSIQCQDILSTDSVFFNGLALVNGDIVSAWNDPDPNLATRVCLTITDVDDPMASITANTIYNSCYECLVNNYTIVQLESCDSATILSVDISEFGEIPTIESAYFIRATGRYDSFVGCFKVRTFGQISLEDYLLTTFYTLEFLSTASFPDCDTCLYGFSAGTESAICNVCYDGSGYTTTTVTAPHPTWTNGQGQAVVQLNAVTLGGPNGLNN